MGQTQQAEFVKRTKLTRREVDEERATLEAAVATIQRLRTLCGVLTGLCDSHKKQEGVDPTRLRAIVELMDIDLEGRTSPPDRADQNRACGLR